MSNNEQWLVECISEENLKNIKKQAYKYNLCNKDIAIFGAGISGMQTCRVLSSMSGFNKKIVFTDNAVDKWNTSICGFPVIKPEEAVERHFYFVISMTSYEEVEAQLHQYGLHKEIDYCVLGNSAENKLLRNIVGVEKNNVILGDCVLETVSMCENEQFSIEHYLMSENTEVLSLDGIYMRTYYYLIEQVLYQNPMTKNIIIVLSVDTFSNKYNFLPKAQHSDIMHKINSLVNNTNADINEYLQILEDREKAKGIIDASSPVRSNKVNIDLSKRNNLVLNLLYKLRKEQESTLYINKAKELCLNNKVKLSFVFPPINYVAGERILGKEFYEQYSSNIKALSEIIQPNEVLDLSFLLDESDFISICSTNEGIRENGRKMVSEKIRELVEK